VPDGPVMPDWPLPFDGPLPPPPPVLNCAPGPGQQIAAAVEIGDSFDFEVAGNEGVVAFFRRSTGTGPLLPYLARRTTPQWLGAVPVYIDSTATPPLGVIAPTHEIAVSLPVPGCFDRRAAVVFQHGGGVWYATDATGATAISANASSHQGAGTGIDLIPAPGWNASTSSSPSCAVFFAVYDVPGIGTERIPLDVVNKQVHWFQTVSPAPTMAAAQHWDGNQHYIFLAAAKDLMLYAGGPKETDPFSAGMMGTTGAGSERQSVEQAQSRQVYVATLSAVDIVQFVEPTGPATSKTTDIAKGWRPSLDVLLSEKREAVAYITPQGAEFVARGFGGPWSKPMPIPGATRIKVRALGQGNWEVVYRRVSPSHDLFAQIYTCTP
jgi:hypothetical protein